MRFLAIIILSYLVGCFSSAYLIGKVYKNIDIRSHGSGNVGATNALRVMGLKLGVTTVIIDIFKGVIGVLIGNVIMGFNGALIGGLFSVIGHNWPAFIGFRGGKGVATSFGVLLMLNWVAALISASIGIVVALSTRYVSVGSISFLTAVPIVYTLTTRPIDQGFLILTIILWLLSAFRHRSNFKRLRDGNENKLGR